MGQQCIYDFLKAHPGESFTAVEIARFCFLSIGDKVVFRSLRALLKAKLVTKEAAYNENGKLTSYYRLRA